VYLFSPLQPGKSHLYKYCMQTREERAIFFRWRKEMSEAVIIKEASDIKGGKCFGPASMEGGVLPIEA
jgi:hypothetical protein